MSDDEDRAQPKTVPLSSQAGRGVVTFFIGAVVLAALVLVALLLDRPTTRDQVKQTPVVPPTKSQ